MYYGSREEQDKAAQAAIDERRQAAACYSVFASVAHAFDGKCYNCKFDNALQAAFAEKFGTQKYNGDDREHNIIRIYSRKESKWIAFYIWIGQNSYDIAFIRKDELTDGKRIPADILIKSAREKREKFLQEAAQLEHEMQMIDVYRQQIEATKKTLESITKNISWKAKDIYNLNYRITH